MNRPLLALALILACILALTTAGATAASEACTLEQTEAYLAEGTNYAFTRKQLDYVIVIDRSGSMQGAKLDTVRRAASTLIDKLGEGDRAAIISFNYEATTNQPLTADKEALKRAIGSLSASFGTQYGPALRLSQRELSDATRDRALIFLSDGKGDFTETPEELAALTNAIARQGVCIMTISYALGDEEATQLKAMSAIGQDLGCGEHYAASDQGTELEEVFGAIRDRLTSTDIINVTPTFIGNTFSFSFTSKLNGKPVPGSDGNACTEEPSLRMELARAGRTLAVFDRAQGTIDLPPGSYTYAARASVRCDGDCGFSGTDSGVITIGDGCNPNYAQLSSYVLEDERQIRITPAGFSPQSVQATQGSTIVWNNTDIRPRTITSAFFNTTIQPGELYAHRVSGVGTLLFVDPELGATNAVTAVAGEGSDILLVFDESGSMRGQPLEEGKVAARQFFDALGPGDRGGLVTFSQGARLVQDFTSDKDALKLSTEALRSGGATSYRAALEMATTLRPVQRPILVLMSDGEPTDEGGIGPTLAIADSLREQGWCIMTVGFGEGGSRARNTLATVAGDDACAAFVYAADGQLSTAFGTIHQLVAERSDLLVTFDEPGLIAFGTTLPVSAVVTTRSGRPVPGGSGVCAPEAEVLATTATTSTLLTYDGEAYSGNITVPYGLVDLTVGASVTSVEALDRPFIGRETRQVLVIPPLLAWSVLGILFFATGVILTLLWIRRRTGSGPQPAPAKEGSR